MKELLLKSKCSCVDIDFGTYKNTVLLEAPFDLYDALGEKKKDRIVAIDKCIAEEIKKLWDSGAITINSCCGHGKIKPSVIIYEKETKQRNKNT